VPERRDELTPHLGAHHLIVGERGPVRRLRRRRHGRVPPDVGRSGFERAARADAPQPRHGGIERNPINPRGQRGIPPEGLDLPKHLQEDVLRDFLGIFPVPEIPERKLLDPRAVEGRQVRDGGAVPGAHAANQIAFRILLTHLWPPCE
jgi:hypothetical protein